MSDSQRSGATRESSISVAHDIATKLWDAGYREADGTTILAMALGIFTEAHEGSHRNLRPLVEAMLKAAQMAYDALHEGRKRRSSNA